MFCKGSLGGCTRVSVGSDTSRHSPVAKEPNLAGVHAVCACPFIIACMTSREAMTVAYMTLA
eukprot:520416-Amphidinium_carterae.1